MGDDNISDIIEWAESQGWTIEVDKNGYRRFFDLHGNYVARYPATPSNPYRRRLDMLTASQESGTSVARTEQERTTGATQQEG
ncbi:hypothetical protein [[Mycobacterium] fortunisiensis]|uniref:hypothetical protein n=1 Tax=[Mycobacterium] fortunisiensis TaxID=2600579 RepID=UPI001FE5AC80